jgi:hypothetical protein
MIIHRRPIINPPLIGSRPPMRYDGAMRRPNLVIGLFLLATILVDLSLPWLRHFADESFFLSVCASLRLSQVSLLGIWLALGRGSIPVRVVIVFFLLVEWGAILLWSTESQRWPTNEIFFAAWVVALVAVPLVLARLFGLRLVRLGDNASLKGEFAESPPRQFSICYLFAVITATALILGMIQFLLLESPAYLDACHLFWHVLYVLIAWASLWIVLGDKRSRRLMVLSRVGGLLVLGNFAMAFLAYQQPTYYWTIRNSRSFLWYVWNWPDQFLWSLPSEVLLPDAVLIVASLLVFRLAGYRLTFGRGLESRGPSATAIETSCGENDAGKRSRSGK